MTTNTPIGDFLMENFRDVNPEDAELIFRLKIGYDETCIGPPWDPNYDMSDFRVFLAAQNMYFHYKEKSNSIYRYRNRVHKSVKFYTSRNGKYYIDLAKNIMDEINQRREEQGQPEITNEINLRKEEIEKQENVNKYQLVIKDLEVDLISELVPLPDGANYLRAIKRQEGNFSDT